MPPGCVSASWTVLYLLDYQEFIRGLVPPQWPAWGTVVESQAAMFQLSREIRFSIDPSNATQRPAEGRNGHAGKPSLTRIGSPFFRLVVTLQGAPQADTGYLLNIKTIDEAVRDRAIPLVRETGGREASGSPRVLIDCYTALANAFAPHRLQQIELHLSPFTSLATSAKLLGKTPMLLLHHTFEFAASHRLHNPAFSDEKNREVFGKCNNPHGHGHNYVLRVSLRGEADGTMLSNLDELERIVDEAVIQPFDHKHLNLEVAEFAELNPSVENIAMVVYRKLRGPLGAPGAALDCVTVWETPRTWCEYRE